MADAFPEKNAVEESDLRLVGPGGFAKCFQRMWTLPIEFRIGRAQRLLRMIEQDAPLLAARVSALSVECQRSAKSHAQNLEALTRAELRRLTEEKAAAELGERSPQGAD